MAPMSLAHQALTAEVIRIVDGDTVDLKFTLWPNLTYEERVRIHGIDTPEKRTSRACEKADGYLATALVETLIPVGSTVEVEVLGFGKFGRPLGNVKNSGGLDVAQTLILNNLAYPYFGEKKKVWKCLDGSD